MYDNVLVTTDGTDGAVPHAVDLADSFESKLHALYVFDPSSAEVLSEGARAEAVGSMEAAGGEATSSVAELAGERGIDVAQAVREGVPHETVLGYAHEKEADIVALRNPASDGSSTAELSLRVVRLSEVPILTVPDTGFEGYDSIVVPTDGSDEASDAAEHAVAFAEEYDATVHAVYVVKSGIYDYNDSPRSIVGMLKEAGEKATDEVVGLAEDAGVEATKTVIKGTPYDEILRRADETDADLIAMGKHGRHAEANSFLGSTTERVLRHSELPVLSVE